MRAFSPQFVPKPVVDEELLRAVARDALDLEIGAGQGLHAIRYCTAHPERTLIAVERTRLKSSALLRRKQDHPALTNLVAAHADAVSIVTHYVRDASLENVFLLYPNPYPKAKHANLRWHNSPFMGLLSRKLKPGARLTLATNVESYAREAAERLPLPAEWGWRLESFAPIPPHAGARTHFEKKYLERGETCWNLVFTRPTGAYI